MQILLRPWLTSDAQALAAQANNRNIFANLRDAIPQPYTVLDAMDWISKVSGHQPPQNFAITWGDTVVGSIGCTPKDDVYRRNIEVGYFVGEYYWGKGIASKAVGLLLEYIAREFEATRVYAEVFENNFASMRVLLKNGFHLEGIRRKAVIKNNVVMDDLIWVKFLGG